MVIQIIDDSIDSREVLKDCFESIALATNPLDKIKEDLNQQLDSFSTEDFIISDYMLKNHTSAYSKVNGDIIISTAYKKHIPGILCSSFDSVNLGLSRTIRRYVPKIISTRTLSNELGTSEYIIKTKEMICNEFKDIYTKQRRPWRALLRTIYYDNDHKLVYVEIPSWEPDTKLAMPLSDFSDTLKSKVIKEDFRFHAVVNLDCEKAEDIYIYKIEEK